MNKIMVTHKEHKYLVYQGRTSIMIERGEGHNHQIYAYSTDHKQPKTLQIMEAARQMAYLERITPPEKAKVSFDTSKMGGLEATLLSCLRIQRLLNDKKES